MATPKRKSPSEYIDLPSLMGMMAQLSSSRFFEISIHTPDDYSYVKELFAKPLAADPRYLADTTRVMEFTILLENMEYQAVVMQLTGDKNEAKQTIRYIYSFEIREGEMCVFNLFRNVSRRLKPRGSKRKTGPMEVTTPVTATSEAQKGNTEPEKQLAVLQKQLAKALKLEDYRFAAVLKKKIDELQSK